MMSEKISAKTKVLYGMADLGIAMLTASVQFFLLYFLTDIVLVDPQYSPAVNAKPEGAGKMVKLLSRIAALRKVGGQK